MFGVTHIVPVVEIGEDHSNIKGGFISGTVVGTGGATMPLVATGAKEVGFVWMQTNHSEYNTATTGMVVCRPELAASTLGSFYPIAYLSDATPWGLNTVSATFKWLALVK
jgi:hypothetical protein